jgi:hypothetical protein
MPIALVPASMLPPANRKLIVNLLPGESLLLRAEADMPLV